MTGDPCDQCRGASGYDYQTLVTLAHPTERGFTAAGIDPCIADVVAALNAAGIQTVASCCGHGYHPGVISLEDDRELFVVGDFETARRIDAAFPVDINGQEVEA